MLPCREYWIHRRLNAFYPSATRIWSHSCGLTLILLGEPKPVFSVCLLSLLSNSVWWSSSLLLLCVSWKNLICYSSTSISICICIWGFLRANNMYVLFSLSSISNLNEGVLEKCCMELIDCSCEAFSCCLHFFLMFT